MPELIIAINIDEGPTRGVTFIFFSCAIFTISAPGSATPGHPASDKSPTFVPFKHGVKKLGKSLGSVNLLRRDIVNEGCDFSGVIFFMNRLAVFSFSTINVSVFSITLLWLISF